MSRASCTLVHRGARCRPARGWGPAGGGAAIKRMGALDGRLAIVTGAATGIGRATARLFAQAGASLVLADVRGDELERTVAEVRAAGGDATAQTADLARPGRSAAVADAAVRVERDVARLIPRGRVGEPEDIARCALFLASPDSAWISGTQIVVDGGALAAT